jgi:RHS repeat-associated protein
MTRRVECRGETLCSPTVYTQTFDVENRLVAVETITGVTTFVYDGDGTRILQIQPGGVKTVYIGAVEMMISGTGRITKTYYALGGQVTAMRVVTATGSAVYYLHGDHLGSVSLITDGSGVALGWRGYLAYGGERWRQGTLPGDRGFTGEREDGSGLLLLGARFYVLALGRFTSADTIVPAPGNPQSLNRYTYALGNPLRYVDPTGHLPSVPPQDMCSYYPFPGCGSSSQIVPPPGVPVVAGVPYVTRRAYQMVRAELLNQQPGMVNESGQIADQALIAISISGEFGILDQGSDVYKEAIEAMSHQYHNEYFRCMGNCATIADQLWMIKHWEAWGYAGQERNPEYVMGAGLTKWQDYLDDANNVLDPSYTAGAKRASFQWGNVYYNSLGGRYLGGPDTYGGSIWWSEDKPFVASVFVENEEIEESYWFVVMTALQNIECGSVACAGWLP